MYMSESIYMYVSVYMYTTMCVGVHMYGECTIT